MLLNEKSEDQTAVMDQGENPVHESLKHIDPKRFPGIDLTELSTRKGLEGTPRYVVTSDPNLLGDTNTAFGSFKTVRAVDPKVEGDADEPASAANEPIISHDLRVSRR